MAATGNDIVDAIPGLEDQFKAGAAAKPFAEALSDPASPATSDVGTDSVELEQMALRMLVADALLTLPERAREMVCKAYFDDQTHAQIAEHAGVPLGTVKSDIRRGLQRLERHLEAFDDARP